ncbi:hypothetical protein [Aestuariivivens marinum]|uniref:hypothetical protein n=1 Tax=Aestuariivivens marinum TaxID=2913555 RepID=UPI001F588D4D|nr:hypothetical protein [Aestuariivivens marinum]
MSAKEEAIELIKEGKELKDPYNFALHACSHIIRDIERGISKDNRKEYWMEVKMEIEKLKEANTQNDC